MESNFQDYLKSSSSQWEEYQKMQKQAQAHAEATGRLFADSLKTWTSLTNAFSQMQQQSSFSQQQEEPPVQPESEEPESVKGEKKQEQTAEIPETHQASCQPASSLADLVETIGQAKIFKQCLGEDKTPQGLQAFQNLSAVLAQGKKK